MSAALAETAHSFLARYEGLREHLPGDGAARQAAAAAFAAIGLPGPRDEAWKYTSLRPLAEIAFHAPLAALADPHAPSALMPALDMPRLVLVDGRMQPDLSVLPDGVRVSGFAAAPEFGALPGAGRDAMAALNTMLAEDGARIEIPEGVDAGVLAVISLASEAAHHPVDFHPRHAIRLGAGARLTLLELARGHGVYLHNPLTELHVGAGATLVAVRLLEESHRSFHLSGTYAEIADGGSYELFLLHLGAGLARSEIDVTLAGRGARFDLRAAQAIGEARHGDITTVVRHAAPHCASRQSVRTVLDGRARGVFQGRIEVARGAQKTDGYQMSQALLLSPDAEMDTKPQLEIYADDVKCSHGATIGELDADQLFYLQSRGVPQAQARGMLVHAFLAETVAALPHAGARELAEAAIEAWLGARSA